MLTFEQLFAEAAARVEYDPQTGKFIWKAKPEIKGTNSATWNTRFAGTECGKLKSSGHIAIRFKIGKGSVLIPAHRLAWYMVHGEVPLLSIDHINKIPTDNRIVNLRLATPKENSRNMSLSAANKSGSCGVRRKANGKFEAYATVDGKYVYLGVHADFDHATKIAKGYRADLGYSSTHGELWG